MTTKKCAYEIVNRITERAPINAGKKAVKAGKPEAKPVAKKGR